MGKFRKTLMWIVYAENYDASDTIGALGGIACHKQTFTVYFSK